MQTSHKRKKAFTLTELLVVVIVIGVLSAVVLPKFSKVVETRKTTEAEELMSAVRTEQEKRCALDKSYVTSLTAVKDIVPSGTSKNYAYSLTSTGMEAQSKGKYGYTLKMPSYADGRICCENEAECAKLNKDYPLCSSLIVRADYQRGNECAGTIQCTGDSTKKCGCLNKGTQTRTCDTSTGTWSGWSACSVSDACECTGTKPKENSKCTGSTCGIRTRSVTCNTSTGEWSTGTWTGTCTSLPAPQTEECGNCGTKSSVYTCDYDSGEWVMQWGACTKEGECAKGSKDTRICPIGQVGKPYRTCSEQCTWGAWQGQCTTSSAGGSSGGGNTGDTCIYTRNVSGECCRKCPWLAVCSTVAESMCGSFGGGQTELVDGSGREWWIPTDVINQYPAYNFPR